MLEGTEIECAQASVCTDRKEDVLAHRKEADIVDRSIVSDELGKSC